MTKFHYFIIWPIVCLWVVAAGALNRGREDYIEQHARQDAQYQLLMNLPIKVLGTIKTNPSKDI